MKKSLTYLITAVMALILAFASCSSGGGDKTIAVTGVSLNKTALTLSIGAQETLTASVQPNNATNKAVTWSSSNANVAAVNGGAVTAMSAGTAAITVTTQDGSRTATCSVTVEPDIAVTGLSLNKNTITLTVGGSESLAPTIQPGNATNQNVTWASGNTNIASVSSSGVVTAASVGNVTITATTQDGSHSASCAVTVAAQPVPVSGLTLNKNTMTLAAGDATGTLVPAIAPINATNQNVTWTSSNTAVATVSTMGIVTPRSVGNATITATAQGAQGNRTAVCTVTVVAAPIQATTVQPNKYSMILAEDNNEAFTATFVPANATNQNIIWTSSDTDIAVVSSSGVVTAIAPGTVTITAASDANAVASASPIATDNANNESIARSGGASIFPAPLTVTVSPAPVPATGVALNKNALALTVGNYETLIPTVYPSNSTNQGVNWLSSDTSIAVVSSGGVVTAINPGTAVITVATHDGGNMYSCTVTVSPAVTPVHPSGVILDQTALTLISGNTELLTATVLPDNASNKNVYWASSNNAVAVAASNGLVTAIAQGTAIITVATEDGGITAMCAVTVLPTVSVTGVSLNKTDMPLTVGGTETLSATVMPENATNKAVTWASSNSDVATVANGLVTAITAGTATITVATQDGDHQTSCAVTVTQPAPEPDVYIATYFGNPSSFLLNEAWLFKNGEPQYLELFYDGVNTSRVNSVYVTDNGDVYAAGNENFPYSEGGQTAILWKNGAAQVLERGEARATDAYAVSVSSGGDVYVLGTATYYSTTQSITLPTLWKNGVNQHLYSEALGFTNYRATISDNGDLYFVGLRYTAGNYTCCYWKNGATHDLGISMNDVTRVNYAPCISVSGEDVYVTASFLANGFRNLVYKNGVLQNLSEPPGVGNSYMLTGVSASGGNVYVTGSGMGTDGILVPILWTNGQAQILQTPTQPFGTDCLASYVFGDDVYVFGVETETYSGRFDVFIVQWKNGAYKRLSSRLTVGGFGLFSVFMK